MTKDLKGESSIWNISKLRSQKISLENFGVFSGERLQPGPDDMLAILVGEKWIYIRPSLKQISNCTNPL